MSPKETEYRYEVKYALRDVDGHALRAWIKGHPQGFRTAYPGRRVNNLYFDSTDFECLRAGSAGLSDRCKLRLRWYGCTRRPTEAVLEQKVKRAGLGSKTTRMCRGPFDLPGARPRDILNRIRANDLGPLAAVLGHCCVPVLFNHYEREYFETSDRRVRLTVDSNLVFHDQVLHARFNDRFAQPSSNVIVVELKASRGDDDLVTRIAEDHGFRATAFSKYSVGLLGLSHCV